MTLSMKHPHASKTSMKIRKAVFPVAGLGTRFLPATKSMPKEMLPVVDKPLIHYAVQEAQAAGVEQFIFITGKGKTAIEDYFDNNPLLEQTLWERGKTRVLESLKTLPHPDQFIFIRQHEPLGLGHAIWTARDVVGDEPFAVLLADELFFGTPGCLSQMVSHYTRGSMVVAEEVPDEQVSRYGILHLKEGRNDSLLPLQGLVEKPDLSEAPSRLAIKGRYIIEPDVFELLGRGVRGAGNEIQITDALHDLAQTQDVFGFIPETGRFIDCGAKPGYLEANIAFALENSEISQAAQDIVNRYAMEIRSISKKAAA